MRSGCASFCKAYSHGTLIPWLALVLSVALCFAPSSASGQPVRTIGDVLVRQSASFDCGLAAVATQLGILRGVRVSTEQLLQHLQPMTAAERERIRQRGYSYAQLAQIARAEGFAPQLVAMAPAALTALTAPAVVALSLPEGPHFSVLLAVNHHTVRLADPSYGEVVWPKALFLRHWAGSGEGYLLSLTRAPDGSDGAPPAQGLVHPEYG